MPVIVRGTKNADLWNEWADILDGAILDADAQQNDWDDTVNAIANVRDSKMWGEKATTLGGLGDFNIKAEGADAAEDEFEEGYDKFIRHNTFSKTVKLSRELRDDNRLLDAKDKLVNMVEAYKRTRLQFLTNALTTSVGATTTMSFGGQTGIDIAGADSLALFNSAHPMKSVSGTTQGNHFKDGLGNDDTVLNLLANIMRNFKDDRGNVLGLIADTIILPGNDPTNEKLVKAIIGSDGEVGSNKNDINTQRGKWKLVVDPLWTPTISTTNHPYIIMSSKGNKALRATRLYDRTPLDVKSEEKTESRNLVYNGYARMSVGFTNWRHVILGGSGDADAQAAG